MTENEKQYDSIPKNDKPTNIFKISHICNKSDTCHLTRYVLMDSTLTHTAYCFFYHLHIFL